MLVVIFDPYLTYFHRSAHTVKLNQPSMATDKLKQKVKMSLFKVCEWWNIQVPEIQEKYDSFSLHCCRLALEENEKDYIVVGSHTGHLGVYQPKCERSEDGAPAGFKPTSVVLEAKLTLPIIGMQSGKFSASTNVWSHLAVLHPLKLCIYSIIKTPGVAEHGDQSKLQLVYEYMLKKLAFSLCKGNFGGAKGREFLCVQHMDGGLRFYEQDGITFECQLPNERTIPSPMLYVPRIDCFVTVSPGWDVECYRYQDLTQSVNSSENKEIIPIWSFCIGEGALDLNVHQISNTESAIVVLGERNLYCLTDNGRSKFIKRLDYTPICFYSFAIGWYWEADVRLMIVIVSESGSMLIYENMNLVWGAQLSEIPVAIQRATFQDLSGAIVSLGREGNIMVGYLGTEPQIFKVPPLNLTDLNFEKAQQELAELEKEIKQSVDVTDISLLNASAERDLNVNVTISSKLENCSFTKFFENAVNLNENVYKMCLVEVALKSNSNFDQIQVILNVDSPLKASNEITVLRDIGVGDVEKLSSWIYLEELLDPISLNLKVLISFINKQSIPRIIEKMVLLPFDLIAQQSTPQKDGKFKINLTVENGPESFASLFREFNIESNATQAIAFQMIYSKSIVTIIQAKSSNSKYRLQSDNITGLSLILSVILNRLKSNCRIITVPQPNVLEHVLVYIDNHYEAQLESKRLLVELESHCGQMRLIERRLLVKIQDRTPNALGGVTNLIRVTYDKLTNAAMKLKSTRLELKHVQILLSSHIAFLAILTKHLDLPPKTVDGFLEALLYPVYDWNEYNWEQIIQPSLEILNYAGPIRKNKNASLDDQPNLRITNEFDVNRFKKQFKTLYERICGMIGCGETRRALSHSSTDDLTIDEGDELEEVDDETKTSDWLNHTTDSIPESNVEEIMKFNF